MSRKTKIAFLGVGSLYFGVNILRDIFASPELKGSALALVDLDESNLMLMYDLAVRLNKETSMEMKIEYSTSRRSVFPDSEFVITAVAANRADLWKRDFALAFKYGMRHTYGESAGVGGLSFTLRNVTIMMEIIKDMEELCPFALLINYSNPEARIVLAANLYSSIKTVGLCHGIDMARKRMAHIMGLETEDVDIWAAGLNHLQWVTDIREAATGRDLYPEFKKCVKPYNIGDEEEGRFFLKYLYNRFGLFPTTDDKHVGEYFTYGWEQAGTKGHDYEADERDKEDIKKEINDKLAGRRPLDDWAGKGSGERAVDIIVSALTNRRIIIPAVNVENMGSIINLPEDAVVEVPAVVDSSGIKPLCMGRLPEAIASILRTQITISRLSVDATMKGSRELALQALLTDPVIDSAAAAEKCLDEMLEYNKIYIPQFK
jgi:alpha-galactosidase